MSRRSLHSSLRSGRSLRFFQQTARTAVDGVWEVPGNGVIDRLLASAKSLDVIERELVDESLRNQRA